MLQKDGIFWCCFLYLLVEPIGDILKEKHVLRGTFGVLFNHINQNFVFDLMALVCKGEPILWFPYLRNVVFLV